MNRTERTISSACGNIRLEGMTVPGTVRDSMRRCLEDDAIFDFAVIYIAGARAGYRSLHKVERSSDDPYCYEGTRVPVNKLNIRDQDVLETKMRDVVPLRIVELEMHPITKAMSSNYFRDIHRHLYGDIFSWAGEYRTEDYSDRPKDCRAIHIGTCVDGLFDDLRKRDFLSDSPSLSDDLAHLICELSAISPFRIGNDVSIRVLANCIAIMNGKYLDFSKASESLMDIALNHGIAADYRPMEEIIGEIMEDY